MGDVYLRYLLTHGARAVLCAARRAQRRARALTRLQQWSLHVQTNRGHNRATVYVGKTVATLMRELRSA